VIDEVDARLEEWVTEVSARAHVAFDQIAGVDSEADVCLHLLELADMPAARGEARPPLQVRLSYLVTTGGSDPKASHRRLGELLFAALANPDYEVRFPHLPGEFWVAAGTAPRAGFVLSVPLRHTVEEAPAELVREPLVVQGAPVQPLAGVVLGPDDVPIADAYVEIPSLLLSTRSDGRGRFRFEAVPGGPTKQHLRVRAKAGDFPFSIDSTNGDEPVALRIDPTKG
jgi:hypothetical protein